MTTPFRFNLLALAISSLLLTGCGDAETTLVEKDPIAVEDEHDDHSGDHAHDDHTIESAGRIAVLSADSAEAAIFDLDDDSVLETFTLETNAVAMKSSAGNRYLVLSNRNDDKVEFIDSGLWRENHGDHLHDYKQAPAMSDFQLNGSRPTHVVNHHGQMAVFYDGDADAGTFASVQVVQDTDIASEASNIAGIEYSVNMHGVAEPRGEHLLSTIRRDDAESTSNAKVLPDQVGVYHLHDGEYELEQTLTLTCPDLHGAAQNHEFVVFGCSDGVLVAHQHGDEYEAEKITNIDALNGMRVGSIYGHEASETFIGVASAHGGGDAVVVMLNPESNSMEPLDWQPQEGAKATSYAFAYEAEQFLILDSLGFLTILTPHEHDGEMEWEFAGRVDISESDVAELAEGQSFKMTVSQNDHFAYVSDPITNHVLKVHLIDMEIEGELELDFVPASIAWLGIAEEEEEGDAHSH